MWCQINYYHTAKRREMEEGILHKNIFPIFPIVLQSFHTNSLIVAEILLQGCR